MLFMHRKTRKKSNNHKQGTKGNYCHHAIYIYIVTVAHVSIYSINKIMGFMHVFKEKNMEIMRKKQFTSSK